VKRILLVLLMIMIVFTVSAGGDKEGSESVGAEQDEVTLTIWSHPIFADIAVERALWDKLNASFESEHPGVKVDQVWLPWEDVWTKRVNAMEAGKTPDISMASAEMIITWADWGYVEPIDDVIEAIGGGDTLWYQENDYYNEHYYCATHMVGGADLLFYRKDLLAEAGYDSPPENWEEWIEVSLAINNPEEEFYALGLTLGQPVGLQQQHWALRAANGGEILNKEGKVVIDSPANAETLQFYYDLFHKYKVIPPASIGSTATTIIGTASMLEWYGNGKVGMYIPQGAGSSFKNLEKLFPEIAKNTGIAVIPAGASGHTATFARTGDMFIHSHAKNIDLAKEYFKFFLSSEEWAAEYAEAFPGISLFKEGVQPSNASEEWYQVSLDALEYSIQAGWPFGTHPANGSYEFALPGAKMVQEVVIDQRPIDEVLADYQAKAEKIYYGN
jgi:ABC-type glycerol-3-phosphate transport system substrate-binding protein